jgi:hypothetical protein
MRRHDDDEPRDEKTLSGWLYRDLPSELQQQLEESSFLAYGWPVRDIAARYAPLSQEEIEEFCENAGLAIVENDGVRYAVMYKPVVLQHPVDGERTLSFNDQELRHDFGQALKREFIADFDGWRWGMHRAAWRSEKLTRPDNRVRHGAHCPVACY